MNFYGHGVLTAIILDTISGRLSVLGTFLPSLPTTLTLQNTSYGPASLSTVFIHENTILIRDCMNKILPYSGLRLRESLDIRAFFSLGI